MAAKLQSLPTELVVEIFTYLDNKTLNNSIRSTCHRFNAIIKSSPYHPSIAGILFRSKFARNNTPWFDQNTGEIRLTLHPYLHDDRPNYPPYMGKITVDLGILKSRGLEVDDFRVRGKRLIDIAAIDENISQPAIGVVKCAYHFRLPSDLMCEKMPVGFVCPPEDNAEKEDGEKEEKGLTHSTSPLSTPISIRSLLSGFVVSVNEQRKRWMEQKPEKWGKFVEWGDNGGITTVRLEFFAWPDFFGEEVLSIRALFGKFEDWE